MKYAFDCYTIYKNFHHDYSVSIAVSLLRMSLIHLLNKDIQLEFEYIQQAFQNLTTNTNSQLLVPMHLFLDRCYLKQKKLFRNFKTFETHYILAEIHQNQSNNNMTIEHYEKSLLFQNYLIEKYDLSIYYYLKILNNKQFDHDNKQINMLHNCLVYCYLKLKQYDLGI
ncbi:unnamed protein product, partial [Rotaria sordida]